MFALFQSSCVLKLHLQDTSSHLKSVGNTNNWNKYLGIWILCVFDFFLLDTAVWPRVQVSWQSFPLQLMEPILLSLITHSELLVTQLAEHHHPPSRPPPTHTKEYGADLSSGQIFFVFQFATTETSSSDWFRAVLFVAFTRWESLHNEKISTPSGTKGNLG